MCFYVFLPQRVLNWDLGFVADNYELVVWLGVCKLLSSTVCPK